MTDKYNDDRDLGWKRLVVKKQSVLQKSFAGALQKTLLPASENSANCVQLPPFEA
ncbi:MULTISPECIES: hypothetical protein [Pantoea]|uniref:hypothetical protein n=1 Tax=Pantoea TaxID=53335 RepID=UPI001F197B4C|nr:MULTISPECIES: hypothetical protein [Pantoea]UIL54634.1 hypothetical protein LZU96_21025 [Pantoea agglomerans]